MSHHLDSPLAREDPRLDLTDHYVFNGAAGTVLVLNVNSSLAGENAPQGFHPEGRYEFKIHLDGAPLEDLTYRVIFGERDTADRQLVRLHHLSASDARDDAAAGTLSAEGHTGTEISGDAGVRLWAGRAADPFYLDLALLGAVGTAIQNGGRVTDWDPRQAANTFAGSTVHSIVVEIPLDDPALHTGRRIGVWSTTKVGTDAGGWRQINREGIPMIWPIFRADEAQATDANSTHPADDPANYGERMGRVVSGVVAAHGTAEDPLAYGKSVAARLLPDILPYSIGTPASFGFAEHNGRTLDDNAPEAMFSLVTNSAISTGLSSRRVGGDTDRNTFPYVAAVA